METPPVEYAVAVDRYLAAARISPASQRVYRVTLNTWGWLLVDRTPPAGSARRGAHSPVVPLGRLDGEGAQARLRSALSRRVLMVDRRTYEREVSILRNAAHWWAARGWIGPEAERALKGDMDVHRKAPDTVRATKDAEIDVGRLFALRAPLREQTLWRLVYESAAPVGHLLALDVSDLDLGAGRVRRRSGPRQADRIGWGERSAELLPLLTIGRTALPDGASGHGARPGEGPLPADRPGPPVRTPRHRALPGRDRPTRSTRRGLEPARSPRGRTTGSRGGPRAAR